MINPDAFTDVIPETLLVGQLVKRLSEFDRLVMSCDTNIIEVGFDGLKLRFKATMDQSLEEQLLEEIEELKADIQENANYVDRLERKIRILEKSK